MTGSDDRSELLREEFVQAWEHYRHLEDNRAWTLGFLFTIVLAAVERIATLVKDAPTPLDNRLRAGIWAIVFVIGLLTALIHARLAKTSAVMEHYVKAWRYVREKVYGDDFVQLNDRLDVYRTFQARSYLTKPVMV